MRKLLLVFTSLFISFSIIAQNDEISDLFNDAKLLMEDNQYEAAIPVWLKAIKLDPENSNFKYKLGFCYYHMHLHGERIKSLKYFRQASSNITKNYDILSPNETQSPIEVFYYLGKAHHLNYEFDKAIASYTKFIEIAPKKHLLVAESERGIQQSSYGKKAVKDSIPVVIRNLGKFINTRYYEHSPVLSLDEEAIYFTSRRLRTDSGNVDYTDQAGKYHEDIYVSYKDRNGEWMKPELLPFSRRNNHDASVSLSADGRTLYVYHDDDGHGALYESKLVNDIWTTPVLMGSDINTKAHETHMTVSADGRRLYFASDRKGSLGGLDIWRCVKLPNGEWSLAQNLGPTVNTKYDDNSPFIHPDGKTLYFTSQGHDKNIGGYDIYYTEINDDGTWSTPQNFGYPINTPGDEEVFSTSPDGKRAYYSSSQKGGNGEGDIFLVEIIEAVEVPLTLVKGRINVPEGTEFPRNIRIIMTDNETGEFIAESRPLRRNGSFVFIIPPGKNYNLSYELDGKEFYNENTYVPVGSEYKEIKKELLLDPLKIKEQTDGSVVVEEHKANEPHNLDDSPIWRIKYYHNDSKNVTTGQTIVYLGMDKKEVLYEEMIDQNGYFKYHELEDNDQKYIFKINNLRDKELCYDGEVVLIGHSNNKKYDLLADGDCIFAEPGEYKAILAHEDISGLITKKLEVIYEDQAGKQLFKSSVRKNGMFGYYHMDNPDDYIIRLSDDAEEFCHKGEITLFRKDKDVKLYHHEDCKFTTKEPEVKPDIKDPVIDDGNTSKDPDLSNNDPKEDPKDPENVNTNNTDPNNTKVDIGAGAKSKYEQNFGYNKYKLSTTSAGYNQFINEVAEAYKSSKDLPLTIQSGASRVPTRTFKNNHELAKSRANESKQMIINSLKAKGVKESDIRFIDITYLVQGPKYIGDYKSEAKYYPFQYVKVWLNK